MSEANKNRLEVQKILIEVLNSGINELNLGDGWKVVEFAPNQFLTGDKFISVQYIRKTNIGWMGTSDKMVDGRLANVHRWTEEQSWQVQVIAKRPKVQTAETVVAEDVAANLIAWLNTYKAMSMLRAAGIAPLIVDDEIVFVYNDNSEIYQKRAVFTVKIQVPKELTIGENAMDAIKPRIKPV